MRRAVCRPMRRWSLPPLAVAGFLITSLGRPSPAEACTPCLERPAFAGETLPPGTRKVPLPLDISGFNGSTNQNGSQILHDGEPVAGRVEWVAETPIFVADAPLADGRYEYVPDPRDRGGYCDAAPSTFEVGGEVPPRPVRTGTLSVVKSFLPASDDSSWPESDTEYATVRLELSEQLSPWKALARIRIDVVDAPQPTWRRSYDVGPIRATSTGELFSARCDGESFRVGKYKVRYTAILVDENESLEPVEVAFDLDCSSAPPKAPQGPSKGPEEPSNGPDQAPAPDDGGGCALAAPPGAPSWSTLAALLSAAALVAVRRRTRADSMGRRFLSS